MTAASNTLRRHSRPSRTGSVVIGGIAVVLVANLIGLVLHGDGSNPFVDGWLAVLSDWAAVVLVALAAGRVRATRPDIVLAAAEGEIVRMVTVPVRLAMGIIRV